jgi:LPXTG-motif cell wall-anchored protein
MTNTTVSKNLINTGIKLGLIAIFVGIAGMNAKTVFADSYGGGDNDIKFKIEKEVKLDGDSSWKDKVYIDLTNGSDKNKEILFRVTVKNLSDDDADEFDKMKMKDFLPGELYRVGGDYLEENWDDFASGEKKEFIIRAKINDDEMKVSDRFEKCVVNKAELKQDDDFKGADTATVCYGNIPVSELPKTGLMSVSSVAGFAFLGLGSLIKLGKKKALSL